MTWFDCELILLHIPYAETEIARERSGGLGEWENAEKTKTNAKHVSSEQEHS